MADKAVVTQSTLDAIGQAIIDKGGATESMTPAQMPAAIAAIPSGETDEPEEKDINFYDAWGKRIYSYTLDEMQALTELPPLPSRDGFVAQEWNWTLEQLKTVDDFADVGGIYAPSDGATHVTIVIDDMLDPVARINFGLTSGSLATLDWGDGSTPEVITSTIQTNRYHTYQAIGTYDVVISSDSGAVTFGMISGSKNQSDYRYMRKIIKLNYGKNARCDINHSHDNLPISELTFSKECFGSGSDAYYLIAENSYLKAVALPSTLSKIKTIGSNCSLKLFLIGFNTVGDSNYTLLPTILKRIRIPFGANIADLPKTLRKIHFPNGFDTINSYSTRSLHSLQKIDLPDLVTAFPAHTLDDCRSLVKIALPPNLSSIGAYSLSNNYSMLLVDFRRATMIPTIDSNCLLSLQSDCKIVVPDALYDDWITATNWSASNIAGHIVKASEYTEV